MNTATSNQTITDRIQVTAARLDINLRWIPTTAPNHHLLEFADRDHADQFFIVLDEIPGAPATDCWEHGIKVTPIIGTTSQVSTQYFVPTGELTALGQALAAGIDREISRAPRRRYRTAAWRLTIATLALLALAGWIAIAAHRSSGTSVPHVAYLTAGLIAACAAVVDAHAARVEDTRRQRRHLAREGSVSAAAR